MTHIYDLANAHLTQPAIVTIGVFDGVHIGHQHLLRNLVAQAHETNRLAVVLTFSPHPDVVLRGITGRYYLTDAEQKAAYLLELGVDHVVTHPFNEHVRQLPAAAFVEMLREHLRLDVLCVGEDFAMGYGREGDVPFLQEQGRQKGFALKVVDLVTTDDNGHVISSTAIREALQNGDIEQANRWLGRHYALRGPVIRGEERGHKIGFPTANVAVWPQQVIPANGVYAGWALLDGERYMAMTNVGVRPTFSGKDVTVEAYLLDFDRDIYGARLEITFETRLRPEKRFGSIDELVRQIHADIRAGRARLTKRSAERPVE